MTKPTMTKETMSQIISTEIQNLGSKMVHAPWDNEEFYKGWLAQTYYLIRHTTKFLALSAARLPLENRDQHYAMLHHIEGETNHDLMPLKDLKDLGANIEQFKLLPETEMIFQLQYYWIEFEHPLSLCGYAFLLEGAAKFFGPKLLNTLEGKYNKKASLFMRVHSVVDQDHYEEGLKFLETLGEKEYEFIARNAQQSCLLYSQMIDRLIAGCNNNQLRVAA